MAFVTLEREGHIALITMNRPEALNALNRQVLEELSQVLDQVEADPELYVAIVTGAGRSFVAGADIGQMSTLSSAEAKAFGLFGNQVFLKLENLSKPTIAAVNGFALGGGCELALSCDIRVATKRSKFGQPEVNLSLIPGAGGTQRLPRLVGPGIAKEMIFTGKIISAEEAKEIGLVNHVTEDTHEAVLAEAEKIAKKIMEKGPVAIQMAKLSINMGCNVDMNTGLMIERLSQTIALSTEDRKEGTLAFLEKRPAQFKGR